MRLLRNLSLGAAAAGLGLLAFAGPASGGLPQSLTVTVTKVKAGGTPAAGASFTVSVACSAVSSGPTTASGNATFTGSGGPTTVISLSTASGNHPFCTVTENPNGGAASTTFSCVPSVGPFASTNICDATGHFNSLNTAPQTVVVTVTNTFPPDPPPPVVVGPRFTG